MQRPFLRFVFVGGRRPWRPAHGNHAPPGEVFELRSIPGDVVACAPTMEQAIDKLLRHLDACFERAGSPDKWYRAEFERMTEQDREELGKHVVAAFEQGRPSGKLTGGEYFQVEETAHHCGA